MAVSTLPRCTCDACAKCLTDEQAAATRDARRLAVRRMVHARRGGQDAEVQWAIEEYRRERDRVLNVS
jgi:hypothetical protein